MVTLLIPCVPISGLECPMTLSIHLHLFVNVMSGYSRDYLYTCFWCLRISFNPPLLPDSIHTPDLSPSVSFLTPRVLTKGLIPSDFYPRVSTISERGRSQETWRRDVSDSRPKRYSSLLSSRPCNSDHGISVVDERTIKTVLG